MRSKIDFISQWSADPSLKCLPSIKYPLPLSYHFKSFTTTSGLTSSPALAFLGFDGACCPCKVSKLKARRENSSMIWGKQWSTPRSYFPTDCLSWCLMCSFFPALYQFSWKSVTVYNTCQIWVGRLEIWQASFRPLRVFKRADIIVTNKIEIVSTCQLLSRYQKPRPSISLLHVANAASMCSHKV